MLQNQTMEDKTYEERMNEALSLIPLYSQEWTNFNPSDPGITILEALTMFETLQQEHINEISSDVTYALLKMAGFEAKKSKPARILLKAEGLTNPLEISQGQPFRLGDIQYESVTKNVIYPSQIQAAYFVGKNQTKDISFILNNRVDIAVKVFGDSPEVGDGVYFICDSLPPSGEEMYFFSQSVTDNRNKFEDKNTSLFAEIEWECYTKNGFVKLNSVDHTGGFLVSGEIRMKLNKEEEPAIYEELPQKGYCIRGRLTKANFDKVPRLIQFDGFLAEAWQRTTKSFTKTFPKGNTVSIDEKIADSRYLTIFVREEGMHSFYKYTEAPSEDAQGRYFDSERKRGKLFFHFSQEKHGFGPDKAKDSVRVLVYDEDTMKNYHLGMVLGFDNQKLDIPCNNIVIESFSILARRTENGHEIYDFVKPGSKEDGDLYYSLAERDGIIRINNAGDFIGAELFMGACATNIGEKGRVRAGNTFVAEGLPSDIKFINPYESTGGNFREPISSLKARFKQDIDIPFTTITASDYENLVKRTPGLCIGKVKAIKDTASNLVKIAVLPSTGEDRPLLRDDYKQFILDMVDKHRILCTKVKVINPEYVAVNVSATIYVKPHYETVKESIEKLIYDKLDFVNSDKQFGQALSYEELFRAIENEPYISYVYDLKLLPAKTSQGKVVDQDIVPIENGLIVPGNIKLEVMINYGN